MPYANARHLTHSSYSKLSDLPIRIEDTVRPCRAKDQRLMALERQMCFGNPSLQPKAFSADVSLVSAYAQLPISRLNVLRNSFIKSSAIPMTNRRMLSPRRALNR